MKKWLLICFILFFPMGIFAFLSAQQDAGLAPDSQIVYAQSKPCVYKFASSMCKDCIELAKLMKKVEPKYSDKINFINYNVDKRDRKLKALIKKYDLTVVPTLVFVDAEGNVKLKVEGMLPQDELEKQLKALGGNG